MKQEITKKSNVDISNKLSEILQHLEEQGYDQKSIRKVFDLGRYLAVGQVKELDF